MKQATIKLVDGQEFIVKDSLRSRIVFEEICDKSNENVKTLKNTYLFLYANLYANNPDTFKYSWDEFLDLTDEFPNLMIEFNSFYEKKDQIEELIQPEKKTKKK